MHTCLYVLETALMTYSCLRQMAQSREIRSDDPSPVYEARRTLSDLACTCKSLKEPALDAPWTDLDSYPLLTCLPVEVCRRSDDLIVSTLHVVGESTWVGRSVLTCHSNLLTYSLRLR